MATSPQALASRNTCSRSSACCCRAVHPWALGVGNDGNVPAGPRVAQHLLQKLSVLLQRRKEWRVRGQWRTAAGPWRARLDNGLHVPCGEERVIPIEDDDGLSVGDRRLTLFPAWYVKSVV